ncbi:hypothetical protein FQN57_003344 [Myotisia sp. PD_48]|nr:hypothetical protein FQN57_003344 [Myotisia sp. PD_48]
MLLEELIQTISREWPCRELQVRQLANLLCHSSLPAPPVIIVHGPEGSGKSTILSALLARHIAGEDSKIPLTNASITTKKRKRRKLSETAKDAVGTGPRFQYAIVKVAECISANHLLIRIVSSIVDSIHSTAAGQLGEEWPGAISSSQCEHISSLPDLLREILDKTGCERFTLVLNGVDELREGGQMLLAALGRVGDMIPSLSIVFVTSSAPRPLSLHISGVPHISFHPYTRAEILSILQSTSPPELVGLPTDTANKLYPSFLSTLHDSLIGPTAGTISAFRSACFKLWPRFVAPILNGESPPGAVSSLEWDFSRLLVRNRTLFQNQGEQLLNHHIIPGEASAVIAVSSSSSLFAKRAAPPVPLPSLPYLPTLLLAAAFLAAHSPPRLDMALFSKFTHTRKRRRRRRQNLDTQPEMVDNPTQDLTEGTPSKSGNRKTPAKGAKRADIPTAIPGGARGGQISHSISSHSFSLERLLAIFRAIDPNPPLAIDASLADTIYPELATLQRLRLLMPASSVAANSGAIIDGAEKWCLNVHAFVSSGSSISDEWIVRMAREIGIDVEEYLGLE